MCVCVMENPASLLTCSCGGRAADTCVHVFVVCLLFRVCLTNERLHLSSHFGAPDLLKQAASADPKWFCSLDVSMVTVL